MKTNKGYFDDLELVLEDISSHQAERHIRKLNLITARQLLKNEHPEVDVCHVFHVCTNCKANWPDTVMHLECKSCGSMEVEITFPMDVKEAA